LDALLAEVIDGALEQFRAEGVEAGQVRFLRYGKLRYENQEHSVEILLPDREIDADATEEIADRFHRAYEREYTYRLDAPVEFVGAHVVAMADVGKLKPARLQATGRSLDDARKPSRTADYAIDGIHEASIYAGELLEPGMRLEGPAVVETAGSTIAVHPGNEVAVDDYGNLLITIA
jgi:N-methylhydantoinase A